MALNDFAGFGLAGYRSFGTEELSLIGPMGRIHLVVGRNNVGKSNVLHFAHDTLGKLRQGLGRDSPSYFPGELDFPRGVPDTTITRVSIGLYRTDDVETRLFEHSPTLRTVLENESFSKGFEDTVWFDLDIRQRSGRPIYSARQFKEAAATDSRVDHAMRSASSALTSASGDLESNVARVLEALEPINFVPQLRWFDTFRRITAGDEVETAVENGAGLVEKLVSIQSPDLDTYDSDSQRWIRLNQFVKDVLDDPEARLEIPASRRTILVTTREHSAMPIDSLGTGVSEVVLLAAMGTLEEGQLICVEEPETHLHPALQRMVVQFLQKTSNNYLMSTHSASILNSGVATIDHIERLGGWSTVSPVVRGQEIARAVSDLGNRPSDLVQSNYIIWVEGPSDRIYIRHLLSLVAPDLIEGAHYSIMFYGGALLNHLTLEDRETREFIDLLKINRHAAIVIDSDATAPDGALNSTKRRVIAEAEAVGELVWVTEGYTFENYLSSDALQAAIEAEYPGRTYVLPEGPFFSPLGAKFEGSESRPSKVSIARRAVSQGLELADCRPEIMDHLERLVERIREASGLLRTRPVGSLF